MAKSQKTSDEDALENGENTPVAEESLAPEVVEQPESADESEEAAALAETPVAPLEPAKPRKGTGFFAVFAGGVVAAVIGFGAARYVVPDGWPFPGVAPQEDPVAAEVEQQARRLSALEASTADQGVAIDALRSDTAVSELANTLQGDLQEIRANLAEIGTNLDGLEARLTAVEKIPTGAGTEAAEAAAAAYERELAGMRAMLEQELARISEVQADARAVEQNAAQAAKTSAGQAALAQVMAALDTGRPYGAALSDLRQATGVEAAGALADHAETGVPTLIDLQVSFPDAARAALDASVRAAVADGSMNRVSAFLRTQLGTRSLEPKEGDDPDAILSRAEGALRSGQISIALDELSAMPDAAMPALSEWISLSQVRISALTQGEELARQVNSN